MSQSNEYMLKMRQNNYGSSGNQNNQENINQNQQQESEDPNSCGKLVCEKWNLTLLILTILSVSIILGILIAYR